MHPVFPGNTCACARVCGSTVLLAQASSDRAKGVSVPNWFRRRKIDTKRSISAQMVREADESYSVFRSHLHEVEFLLDRIVNQFSTMSGVMAEALVRIEGTGDLLTVDLKPDSSPALFRRVRSGEGITGKSYQTSTTFIWDRKAHEQESKGSADNHGTHLLSSQSALVIPLEEQGDRIGALTLESPHPHTFQSSDIDKLNSTGLLQLLANELTALPRAFFRSNLVASRLISALHQRIAFAIDPENLNEAYYQVLSVATQVVHHPTAGGGLILVYDGSQFLAPWSRGRELFAVRAATVGGFESAREWRLDDASIARRVIQSRRTARILDVTMDPDYRDSGTGLAESSELLVPLVDADNTLGVIGLVSPMHNAFVEEDQTYVEEIATAAVYAVRRIEQIRQWQRQREQLNQVTSLQEMLAALFRQDMRQMSMGEIFRCRDQIALTILEWATEKTASDVAALLLAEKIVQQETELVINKIINKGASGHDFISEDQPKRWKATLGLTGLAFTEGKTLVVPDVRESTGYIGSIGQDMHSALASPLRVGETVLGILYAEAKSTYHFASDQINWIEFLSGQAAFALTTIAQVEKSRFDLTLSDINRLIDRRIEAMREVPDLSKVRVERTMLISTILNTLLPITSSDIGNFFLALNAYADDGKTINLNDGMMVLIAGSNSEVYHSSQGTYFSLHDGVQGKVFTLQQTIVFNDRSSRPAEYFSLISARESQAGVFVPVVDGARVLGVLSFESQQAGVYNELAVGACIQAGNVISKLVTQTRLRILELERELLRALETEMLIRQSADNDDFMHKVLVNAARLADLDHGWGAVLQLGRPSGSGPLITERSLWLDFEQRIERFTTNDKNRNGTVTYPYFVNALRTKATVLITDSRMRDSESQENSPWPVEARSVICVPLLALQETGMPGDRDAVGLLALAHPNPGEFSDIDKDVLSSFAESVVIGLRNIELIRTREQTMKTQSIFISYRRLDTAPTAGRIYDRLVTHFGESRVMLDVDDIPAAEDFREFIRRAVSQCAIVLAVIGHHWLDAANEYGQRRLDDANDTLRLELETALSLDIPILPLLVDGTPIPTSAQLPASLERLTRINGLPIRNSADFAGDIHKIIQALSTWVQ